MTEHRWLRELEALASSLAGDLEEIIDVLPMSAAHRLERAKTKASALHLRLRANRQAECLPAPPLERSLPVQKVGPSSSHELGPEGGSCA